LVIVSQGWGTAGKAATVYFWNLDDGAIVKILQLSARIRFELDGEFYEKLNPSTIVESVYPAFLSNTKGE